MCDCYSYNGEVGTVPAKILQVPKEWQWEKENVEVDACIADQVLALWDAGIVTLSSCCGHEGQDIPHWPDTNPRKPSVVLSEGAQAREACDLLKKIDPDRTWTIFSWRLCEYNRFQHCWYDYYKEQM